MPDEIVVSDERLDRLVATEEIREVVLRYCRGVDRRQFELVRSCYHRDAVDHHGVYVGPVDGFIEQLETGMGMYERTTHFIGNIAIEVDGRRARSESYLVAYHRIPAGPEGGAAHDFVIGGRYVDDFEERDGEWRIATRICVVDWARFDPVGPGPYEVLDVFHRGQAGAGDPVFAKSLDALCPSSAQAAYSFWSPDHAL